MDMTTKLHRPSAATIYASRNSVASLTFLAWDIILTMDSEVQYIWNQPFTYTSGLYLFIRYFALCSQIALVTGVDTLDTNRRMYSPAKCRSWLVWMVVSAQLELASVQIASIMTGKGITSFHAVAAWTGYPPTVHALYGRHMKLTISLIVLYALELIVMTTSVVESVLGSHSNEYCVMTVPVTIVGYGVAAFAYETILFSLILAKFTRAVKDGWGHFPMLRVIVRDGVWAFALIFTVVLANCLLYGLVKNALASACFPWLLSASSFAGYRLLLNMRSFKCDENDELTNSMDDCIEFDSHIDCTMPDDLSELEAATMDTMELTAPSSSRPSSYRPSSFSSLIPSDSVTRLSTSVEKIDVP